MEDRLRPYVSDLLATWRPDAPAWQPLSGAFMFADVSGFTALSEQLQHRGREGAELLNGVITTVLTAFVDAARRQGGDVLAFGGDAILVHVGGDDPVPRLVAAAAAMQATLEAPVVVPGLDPVQLGVSIGIHQGTATALRVQVGHQVECVVVGRTITDTLRAEAVAEAGQVLVSHAAAAAVPTTWHGDTAPDGVLMRAGRPDDPPPPGARPVARVPLEDLVAPEVARIAGTLRAVGMHRRVAVGFLRLDRLDHVLAEDGPEATHDLVAEVFSVLADQCTRTGASILTVDSYPDAVKVMVCAGAPVAADDNEGALVEALRATIAALPTADVHVGAHRGLAFAGDLGAPARRGYTVLGDTVNLAARLMQRAAFGELLVSDVLARRVDVARSTLPPFRVKGKSQPVQAHRVEAGESARTVVDLPLLGRELPLANLDAATELALTDRVAAVDVLGPPGVGKSRLLREVANRHPELSSVVVTAAPYTSSTPYSTAKTLLRGLLRIPRDLPATEAGTWLTDLVARAAPELVEDLHLVALPLDAEPSGAGPLPSDPAALQRRVAAATARLLQGLQHDPMLLVVDDAQWMDSASREVLRRVASDVDDRPWVLAGLSRPEARPVFEGVPGAVRLDLDGLDDSAAEALVRTAAGDRPLFDDDVATIVHRAHGNPLFLVELARLDTEEVPDDVETLVARRLDRLPPGAHRLLGIAAVLGNTVDREVVEAVARRVDALAPSEQDWQAVGEVLPRTHGSVVEWREPVFREAAYAGLPLRRRRALHRAVHDELALRPSDGSLAADVARALHADRGELAEAAWELLQKTGSLAADAGASVDAVDLLGRAARWGEQLGSATVPASALAEVLGSLGEAAELAGRLTVARDAFDRAIALLEADDRDRIGLQIRLGRVLTQAGEVDTAATVLDEARRTADRPGGDIGHAMRARVALAGLAHRRGDHQQALGLVREVDAGGEAAPMDALARARLLGDVASLHTGADDWVPGRGLALFELVGDDVGVAHTRNNLGLRAYYRGAWQEAVDHWGAATAAARLAGDLVSEATMRNNIAEVVSDRGDWDGALDSFLRAARTWEASRYLVGVALAHSNAGRARARLGQHEAAAADLRRAGELFTEIGTSDLLVDVALRRAELAWLASRLEDTLGVLDGLADDLESQPAWVQVAWRRLWGAVRGSRGIDDLRGAHHQACEDRLPFEQLQCAALLAARGREEYDGEISALARRLGVARLATPDGPHPLAS